MNFFLQPFKELLNKFACIGEILTDDEVVKHVLMAMPKNYKGIVNSIMYQPELPSFGKLIVIITQDNFIRELCGKQNDETTLIKSVGKKSIINRKTTSRNEESRYKKRVDGECHFCGQKGHCELHLVDSNQSSEEWYIDSGVSKHVNGTKQLLKDLEMGSRSKISIACKKN